MITYYLYRKSDKCTLPLGDVSFGKFYAEDGWFIFEAMIKNNDLSINNFVVRRSDSKNDISIEDFFTEIEKYEILIDK